jgi:PAS domain S-box-containing protein
MITEISASLVTSTPDQIDASTNRALATLGQYLSIDRIQLLMFLNDLTMLRCTHEWIADDVPRAIDRLQTQRRDDYPWIFQRLSAGELIVIPDTRELPDEMAPERDDFLDHAIRSTMAVPMCLAGRVVGVLWLDRLNEPFDWPDEIIRGLKLVGEILANGLERMRAERALSESRQFAEAISESSPNVIYVIDVDDSLDFRVSYINRQVTSDFGHTPEEMLSLGNDVIQLIHPEDLPQIHKSLQVAVSAEKDQVIDVEFRVAHIDGGYRSFLTRNRVFRHDTNGFVRQIIGTAQDITDRSKAEEALHQHRDHLAHVARLGALGEMVAGVAHEIGQPLYSIVNFAKASQNILLTISDENVEPVRNWTQHILTSAARAGEIIHRLRDFGRRGGIKRIVNDPDAIIREAIALVNFAARRQQVKIELAGTAGECPVKVDRVQIQQVVVNLLQNALDATPRCDGNEGRVVVHSSCQEVAYIVDVVDEGIGLPSADLQIFQAFVTTKHHGLGMGLAICKTIVEDHGGRISAANNADRGATFRFTLPIAKDSV